ncbi:hypothetical protein GGU10DRAFT_365901 [Lentinula aff. detonsa]|uniref:Uncharacterized protein n=1 Tax=Lentinula aff. detonsa TaxID=2804958 RepID=A0AA38NJY4_9AGAR|nr:hypothetical protein GGU10DRAFT_365901 [Lentinula aff. detonsa]
MLGLWPTLNFLVVFCHLMHGIDATPLVARRACFDENDNPTACPQAKWSKSKIIIICTIVGIVLILMIASYIVKYRRTQRQIIRPLARPLTVRAYPQLDSQSTFLPRRSESPQKGQALQPYVVSESDTSIVPPPPAYTL